MTTSVLFHLNVEKSERIEEKENMTSPQQPQPYMPVPQPQQPNAAVPQPQPYASASQQYYPPAAQQPQPMAPVPVPAGAALRTKRGLLKFVLLGLITFGIYDIWQMSEVGETLNLIATRRDGKRTMHYCLMFFIVGWLTFGIGWLVWNHRLSARIGTEQAARHLPVTVTAATYWLWSVLGTLIIVGPLVYTYKILHAMNDLSADYNMRGI